MIGTESMIGTVRGVITLILMVLFIALTIRTWSKSRKESFDSMARLPLEDDDKSVTRNVP